MKVQLRKTHPLPSAMYSAKFPYLDDILQTFEDLEYNLDQYRKYTAYLEDQIAELKKHPKKPQVKPSTLEKKKKKKKAKAKRKSKPKNLEVHQKVLLSVEGEKEGWRFKGYKDFLVQDLCIETRNTLYRRERWVDDQGREIVAQLPKELKSRHFGPHLIHWILHQYHHAHVTIPLLHQQLCEIGIEISRAEISHLLLEEANRFSEEAESCFKEGVDKSKCLGVDDTSARVGGKNETCLYLGNSFFSQFITQGSKSRLSFLEALCEGKLNYRADKNALSYMRQHGTQELLKIFSSLEGTNFSREELLKKLPQEMSSKTKRIAQEACLWGELIFRWGKGDKFIMSDGAKQYHLFSHATCWIHAFRLLEKVFVRKNSKRKTEEILQHLKKFYHFLKRYSQKPREDVKKRLLRLFDMIADLRSGDTGFDKAFDQFISHKEELLRVLEHPDIPLHNNLAEQSLREVVIRRKISGGAKNDRGAEARDLFCSLKQTCRKLGISFWSYLKDRIFQTGKIPPLAKILSQKYTGAPGF